MTDKIDPMAHHRAVCAALRSAAAEAAVATKAARTRVAALIADHAVPKAR